MRDEAVHAILLAEQLRLEPERFAKEVRYVRNMDWKTRACYLKEVAEQRGAEAGDRLRAAVVAVQGVAA